MSTISEITETTTYIDEEGNSTQTIKSTSKNITRNTEPDYIKLYTRMWCEFNEIPNSARPLFLQLVTHMSYANTHDVEGGQLVQVSGYVKNDIMEKLGIGESMLYKQLNALIKCNAIKKIVKYRGTYQINPQYAGRGEWKYNPKEDRGGVEDLVATFKFKDKTVSTNIIWSEDGEDNDFNDMYHQALGVNAKDNASLKTRKIS